MTPSYWRIVEPLYAMRESLSEAEASFVTFLFESRRAVLSVAKERYLRKIWLRHHDPSVIEPPWLDAPAPVPTKKKCEAEKADDNTSEYQASVERHHQAYQSIITKLKGK